MYYFDALPKTKVSPRKQNILYETLHCFILCLVVMLIIMYRVMKSEIIKSDNHLLCSTRLRGVK